MLLAPMLFSAVILAPPQWVDVAPILTRSCTPCHTGDGAGAYPLASASELRRRRTTVAAVLADHSMPPWLPSNSAGTFLHELRMTDADRAVLSAWVEAGCEAPEVDAHTTRVPDPEQSENAITLLIADGWSAGVEERDAMRSFAVPLHNERPLRVCAARARFANPGHVGHVTFAADNTGEAERLDALDGAIGFKLAGDIGNVSSGSLLGVGADGNFSLPNGYCVAIPAHATLVAEVHASGRGKTEDAGFTLALCEASADATLLSAMPIGSRGAIPMPSDAPEIIVTQSSALEYSYEIVAVIARPGRLAVALQLTMLMPGTSESRELLTIPRYDSHRDRPYAFAKPIRIEHGSRLRLATTFETPLAATRSTPECVLLLYRVPNTATPASSVAQPTTASTAAQQASVRQMELLPISPTLRAMTSEVTAKEYEMMLARACPPRTGTTHAAGSTYFDAAIWCNAASAALGKRACYLITQTQLDANAQTVSAIVELIDGDGFRLPTSAEWTQVAASEASRDAAGSVWEWCEDTIGEERVVRGGSWADPTARQCAETTASVPPNSSSELFGFRAVVGPRNPPQ